MQDIFCHTEEYIGLDDNKYIGDLLAEFKASKDRSKGEILHCKLTLKKKLFRESDEAITDPMFLQLSYVQVCNFLFKKLVMLISKYYSFAFSTVEVFLSLVSRK